MRKLQRLERSILVQFLATWIAPMSMAQTSEDIAKIRSALPSSAVARPASARKVLVFTATRGFRHDSIPVGTAALRLLGESTGAFATTHTEDIASFEAESLKGFDAVVFLNTTGELFRPADFDKLPEDQKRAALQNESRLQANLTKFVEDGKGLVGIHAATDTCYKWGWYGGCIGGYFDGHPWNAGDDVVIRVDDPKHPVAAVFDSPTLELKEELYQLRDPYSREKQRVLLTLDIERTNMKKDGIRRQDGDFGVSWVKRQGAGRVFYTSLGHNRHIYWHPQILKHYLAGIQFAIGDLQADTSAIPHTGRSAVSDKNGEAHPTPPTGFTALFNGKDLTGWRGLVAPDRGPPARANMSPDELKKAQSAADEQMSAHWSVRDGVLVYDGKGQSLVSAKDYRDFEMLVDWKIEAGGDSGIYLRGCPQVQIWDTAKWPEGSGGLYNNEKNPKKPLVVADNPIGEWNTFRIKLVGDRVTVHLNDKLVVDNVVLENYWERGKPLYPDGPIELQHHSSPLAFRNIYIREIETTSK